eukprot:3825138-Prymnesium_polylepis.1
MRHAHACYVHVPPSARLTRPAPHVSHACGPHARYRSPVAPYFRPPSLRPSGAYRRATLRARPAPFHLVQHHAPYTPVLAQHLIVHTHVRTRAHHPPPAFALPVAPRYQLAFWAPSSHTPTALHVRPRILPIPTSCCHLRHRACPPSAPSLPRILHRPRRVLPRR